MTYSVLFVCLGNICRSPMAEAVFRDLVRRKGWESRIVIDSAGTGDWHVGHPPHEGTRRILERNNISCEGLRARQLRRQDGETFDLIVAMDGSNERDIRKVIGPEAKAEVIRLMSLVPEWGTDDVPDPYYSGKFAEVYEMVSVGADRLLERIRRQLGEQV